MPIFFIAHGMRKAYSLEVEGVLNVAPIDRLPFDRSSCSSDVFPFSASEAVASWVRRLRAKTTVTAPATAKS